MGHSGGVGELDLRLFSFSDDVLSCSRSFEVEDDEDGGEVCSGSVTMLPSFDKIELSSAVFDPRGLAFDGQGTKILRPSSVYMEQSGGGGGGDPVPSCFRANTGS